MNTLTAQSTTPTRRPPVSHRLAASKIIAVLRARHVRDLIPVCDVLVDEGILSLELTLTTPGLLDDLSTLVDRYADAADVGVGTVLTIEDARRALQGGARYLVTPNLNLDIVQLAVESGVPSYPGGLTPTELKQGWDAGAAAVKIFPAQTVGDGYLKHLHAPFPDLQAVPSGGIDADAARKWLAAGAVAVSIGGPLLGDALAGGDLDGLRGRCRTLRAVVDDAGRP